MPRRIVSIYRLPLDEVQSVMSNQASEAHFNGSAYQSCPDDLAPCWA